MNAGGGGYIIIHVYRTWQILENCGNSLGRSSKYIPQWFRVIYIRWTRGRMVHITKKDSRGWKTRWGWLRGCLKATWGLTRTCETEMTLRRRQCRFQGVTKNQLRHSQYMFFSVIYMYMFTSFFRLVKKIEIVDFFIKM